MNKGRDFPHAIPDLTDYVRRPAEAGVEKVLGYEVTDAEGNRVFVPVAKMPPPFGTKEINS